MMAMLWRLMTTAPIVLVALLLATAFAHNRYAGRAMNVRRTCLSLTVLVTYLVLPAVTTIIFRTFDCERVDDPRSAHVGAKKAFLRADYGKRCEGEAYAAHVAYAMLCVVVWPRVHRFHRFER